MRDDRPVKQRYYPKNPAMQRVIDDQVNELLAAGQIEPSTSPYSTPIVLVRKKNDESRHDIDTHQLPISLGRSCHLLAAIFTMNYVSILRVPIDRTIIQCQTTAYQGDPFPGSW